MVALWLAVSLQADVLSSLRLFDQAEDDPSMLRHAIDFFQQLEEVEILDSPINIDSSTPADTLRMRVWYWAAEYYYYQQEYEISEQYGRRSLPLYRLGNDRVGEADCLNILAIANIRLSDYEDAVDFAKQCYLLDAQNGDVERMCSSLNTLAGIYMSAYQPAEAEQYVLRGIDLATSAGILPRKAVLLGMASEVYNAMGDCRKALDYAEQAYALEQQLGREERAMIRLSQKASALIGLQRYDEAEGVLGEAIIFFRHSGDRHSLAICYNKMGRIQLARQHDDEAVAYYREAARIFLTMGDKTNEMHSRKGLYQSLWTNHPDSARIELERFNDLKDSLYTNTSAKSLARFNAEFGNDWLKKENDAQRLAKRNVLIVAIVVIIVLMILMGVVWWMMRRRQHHQAVINRGLSADIEELREKYKELSVRYDKALVTSSGEEQHEDLSTADREFLERVVNAINELMFKGQVDAEGVAAKLNMSLFQLRQRLSTLVGETPQAFIAIVRMKRARYLLDNRPELNISEVAQLCAYNETANFSRAFKKTFGISPTQYQEKQKEES